jgi:predicted metal-dependent hydrolase
MEVKIVRSRRRLRTVSARLVNNMLLVQAPATLAEERLEDIVNGFKTKFERKKIKEELDKSQDLKKIAAVLNKKYFGGRLKINSVEYVTVQDRKFGCCNYGTGNIRISHRIGLMPEWVRDYVLVHEMAHLIEPNHSKSFWDIVSNYGLAERAKGFLIASGLEMDND